MFATEDRYITDIGNLVFDDLNSEELGNFLWANTATRDAVNKYIDKKLSALNPLAEYYFKISDSSNFNFVNVVFSNVIKVIPSIEDAKRALLLGITFRQELLKKLIPTILHFYPGIEYLVLEAREISVTIPSLKNKNDVEEFNSIWHFKLSHLLALHGKGNVLDGLDDEVLITKNFNMPIQWESVENKKINNNGPTPLMIAYILNCNRDCFIKLATFNNYINLTPGDNFDFPFKSLNSFTMKQILEPFLLDAIKKNNLERIKDICRRITPDLGLSEKNISKIPLSFAILKARQNVDYLPAVRLLLCSALEQNYFLSFHPAGMLIQKTNRFFPDNNNCKTLRKYFLVADQFQYITSQITVRCKKLFEENLLKAAALDKIFFNEIVLSFFEDNVSLKFNKIFSNDLYGMTCFIEALNLFVKNKHGDRYLTTDTLEIIADSILALKNKSIPFYQDEMLSITINFYQTALKHVKKTSDCYERIDAKIQKIESAEPNVKLLKRS